jgi:hypothetical protein
LVKWSVFLRQTILSLEHSKVKLSFVWLSTLYHLFRQLKFFVGSQWAWYHLQWWRLDPLGWFFADCEPNLPWKMIGHCQSNNVFAHSFGILSFEHSKMKFSFTSLCVLLHEGTQ